MPREWVEAAIIAGGIETTYIRAGTGDTLVFPVGDLATVPGDPLFDRLTAEFRVIAAKIPPELGDTSTGVVSSSWLRGFVDGLGLERLRLLVPLDVGHHD